MRRTTGPACCTGTRTAARTAAASGRPLPSGHGLPRGRGRSVPRGLGRSRRRSVIGTLRATACLDQSARNAGAMAAIIHMVTGFRREPTRAAGPVAGVQAPWGGAPRPVRCRPRPWARRHGGAWPDRWRGQARQPPLQHRGQTAPARAPRTPGPSGSHACAHGARRRTKALPGTPTRLGHAACVWENRHWSCSRSASPGGLDRIVGRMRRDAMDTGLFTDRHRRPFDSPARRRTAGKASAPRNLRDLQRDPPRPPVPVAAAIALNLPHQ